MPLDYVAQAMGVKKAALIAGFFGGLAALPFISARTWFERASIVLGGAVASGYCTPIVVSYFFIQNDGAGGIGFGIGAFGMAIVWSILEGIRKLDVASLIAKRIGGDK